MDETLVEFENVTLYSDDKKNYLENISFNLAAEKKVFIVGNREKERILILKSILGLIKPQAGIVKIMGSDVSSLNIKELYAQRKKIGFVHAEEGLIKNISIKDNIILPLDFCCEIDGKTIKERLEKLSLMLGLESFLNKKSWNLESFLEKKVLFSRALSIKPLILLINEPTSYIEHKDFDDMKKIIDSNIIYDFCAFKPLIIITTEDRDWAKDRGDIIIHLRNNTLLWSGKASDFENN